MDWKTFGHENIKNLLSLQLGSGRLSHAYLFKGPEGIGKKMLALEFAGRILQAENPNIHPDFSLLDGNEEITIEAGRQFMEGLNFKPFAGAKKVAIINNAQLLNTQSGNALLKTLEEPSPSTILILVSSGQNILPTIVSRCQTFSFNAFTKNQLVEFAGQKSLRLPDGAVNVSYGKISRLLSFTDVEVFAQEKKIIEKLAQLQQSSRAERLLAIPEFAELETAQIENLVTSWLFFQRNELKNNPRKFTTAQEMLSTLFQLQTNKNKKLILQNLFLKI